MKRKLHSVILTALCLLCCVPAIADVTLTSSPVPAANLPQGSSNNILYIVKADATVSTVTMSRIQFTLSGTMDNDDLTANSINVYFNPTAPTLAGAGLIEINASGTFAAPHAYDLSFNLSGTQTIAAGNSGYFIITATVSNTATNGNTIKVDGAANPVTFTYTTAPTVINNQTNVAGFQTIQAAAITLTTISSPAATVTQGSTNNIIYITKADVTVQPVTMNRIQFTISGTMDNDDLTANSINVYFNPTAPTLAGAGLIEVNASGTFAAPHAYDLSFNLSGTQTIAAGNSGYFIITATVSNTATNGNTIKVDGAANPVTFSYTTAPTITNSQTNVAGVQTIQAPAITLTTISSPAATVTQGSTNNIVYIIKADVTAQPVTMNRIQFTLTGTMDNDDLTANSINVVYNPTAPTLAGSSLMEVGASGTFAAPHSYDLFFNQSGAQTIAAGASGYFIITVNVSSTATNGNTIKVDGAANPVTFSYTTAPTVTNNQTNVAGVQTIQAPAITLTTISSPAATVIQGSTNNIVYIIKADVTAQPVTMNRIQFTLSGTMDNDDLTANSINVSYNPTAPTLAGSSLMEVGASGTFAAPHAYDLFFNQSGAQTIAAGASGYFIITVNVSSTATNGNTIKVDGAANPVTFSYTTAPTVTNNQTNVAGVQTIQAPAITFTTGVVPATNIAQGSTNNIVYIIKADVTAQPVTMNRIQFTLSGTMDNDDLTANSINVSYNPTAPTLAGSSLMEVGASGTFAAPHAYDLFFNQSGAQTIAAGASGYFIITVNVSSTATSGNTLKIDGAANPVTFSYTTAPTITNNQTDIAGLQTIRAVGITLSTPTLAPAPIFQGSNNNIIYVVKADVTTLPVTISRIQFTITGTMDNDDLTNNGINVYFNPSSASLSGATLMVVGSSGAFAAPHAYDLFFNSSGGQTIAAGASGYFIITVNVDPSATVSNTVKVNGASNPVTFTYATGPTITDNQADAAGVRTIQIVLPLTLIDFNGHRTDSKTISLGWTTAGEFNTKEFDVERSDDGRNFNGIAVLNAANYSTQLRLYNYTDNGRAGSDDYYRLKMVDNDGSFTYSKIIKIAPLPGLNEILAFPNPFNKNLQLQVQMQQSKTVEFILSDASGKRMATKFCALTKGNNAVNWELPELAAGNYFISCSDGLFKTVAVTKL